MTHDRRAFLCLSAAALTLVGCGDLVGPPEASPIYVMRPSFPVAPAQKVTWSLALVRPNAPGALDTDRIALIQPGGVMDYYARAQFPDPLPALVETALLDAFIRTSALPGVGRAAEGLRSDYHLFTDIREFEARYAVADGIPDVVVTLDARMVVSRGRAVAGNMSATRTVRAAANSVPAVTQAMSEALAGVVGEIVSWALVFPQPVPPQSAT